MQYNQLTMFDVCASRYVMDELGSALRHSDEPNFRVSPFLYMPDGKLASAIRFSFFAVVLLNFKQILYLFSKVVKHCFK